MNIVKKKLVDFIRKYKTGEKIIIDPYFISSNQLNQLEFKKTTRRTEIINYFVSLTNANNYLEIGVRDPRKNFDKINCKNKFSVDPGVEFEANPVDFKLTSDEFFNQKAQNKFENIKSNLKFDAIFIDGLHLASQVEKDIKNALENITDDGFIILHDCNPPSEYHQRENYDFKNSPAGPIWNGTTWKAFYKYRHDKNVFSICFDTDWGVAVISKNKLPLFNNIESEIKNKFYDFESLNQNRTFDLNLQEFISWKNINEKN